MSTTRRYVSPKREAKAAATRQAILEAFRDQLMEPGRDSLSPTDAAATVGCSVRTVHGHFPTGESRIEALAALLEEELYAERLTLPATADHLPEYYRTIHRAALDSPFTEALVSRAGEWRQVRSRRRTERLEAVRQVVAAIGAPAEPTEEATAVLVSLAGGEVTLLLRDQAGLVADRIPDALAHTVELIVADLRQAAARAGGSDGDRTTHGDAADDRPPIWAGHLGPLVVGDLDEAIDFYRRLGFRPATRRDDLVSLEMRGGTHLVLLRGDEESTGREAPFDLMVDDLPAFRASMSSAGIEAGPIEIAGAHHRCWVTDPSGHRIRIHDSHAIGPV